MTKEKWLEIIKLIASFAKNSFILFVLETKEIIDRKSLEKFNIKNLKKGGVL